MDFARQAVSRGLAQNNWYLTSVQAGFEPWQNGAGLAVTSFSSSVNKGSSGDPGTPGGSTACKVAYGTNAWQGGFTADVTITNTGASPVSGWKLAFTPPLRAADHQRVEREPLRVVRSDHREQREPQQ